MESQELKRCGRCDKLKPLTDFGWYAKKKKHYTRCLDCQRKVAMDAYNNRPDPSIWTIRDSPNAYLNAEQRQEVFEILLAMKWTFNEDLKIWWKLPMKDSEGNWYDKGKMLEKKRPKLSLETRRQLVRDKEEGMSVRDIATKYDITYDNAFNYLRKNAQNLAYYKKKQAQNPK